MIPDHNLSIEGSEAAVNDALEKIRDRFNARGLLTGNAVPDTAKPGTFYKTFMIQQNNLNMESFNQAAARAAQVHEALASMGVEGELTRDEGLAAKGFYTGSIKLKN